MKNYVGDTLQVRGAEQYVLKGGKGEGMNFLYVRNGLGLEAWISLDRCGDLSRVIFKGNNMGYFSPCGYVAPQYYDKDGLGFLKSFTAGFCTTCGLTNIGSPCVDEGEELPQHGTISNVPAILNSVVEENDSLAITLTVKDCRIFSHKLVLTRKYIFSYTANTIEMKDTVTNEGDKAAPYLILYHCNMGYPLLSENSRVVVPNNKIWARSEHSAALLDESFNMEKPTAEYEECCYYYDICEKGGIAKAGVFNKDINSGMVMSFNKKELPWFIEWKMMGKKDYALGLEPANCELSGRASLRENGTLKFIEPENKATQNLTFAFCEGENEFDNKLN